MSDRFENDETHQRHPAWIVQTRACVFCGVLKCGCPSEPEPVLVEAHIIRGEE